VNEEKLDGVGYESEEKKKMEEPLENKDIATLKV
jgi:hypothetical protein